MTRPSLISRDASPRVLSWLLASEMAATVIGFGSLIHVARHLGASSFAGVEFATLLASVMLVWVRGGIESIALRECSRKPRLIGRWATSLIVTKIALAILAFGLLCVVTTCVRSELQMPIIAAGLILFPSAFLADLGLRAEGRLGWVAVAQLVRAASLAIVVTLLVRGSDDAVAAAVCAVIAECITVGMLLAVHVHNYGPIRLRVSARALRVLCHRGMIASVSRFGRVVLFTADMLVLGFLTNSEGTGSYAAARRIVFALIGVGIIFPSAVAPMIARASLSGPFEVRAAVARASRWLLAIALPASLGLIFTSRGWMEFLFGETFRDGGPALAILAARLPILLLSVLNLSALVAVREERAALKIVGLTCGLAAVLVPFGVIGFGWLGAGVSMLVVETFLAAGGWISLQKRGFAPSRGLVDHGTIIGCGAMSIALFAMKSQPVWIASFAGAAVYGTIAIFFLRVRVTPNPGSRGTESPATQRRRQTDRALEARVSP